MPPHNSTSFKCSENNRSEHHIFSGIGLSEESEEGNDETCQLMYYQMIILISSGHCYLLKSTIF